MGLLFKYVILKFFNIRNLIKKMVKRRVILFFVSLILLVLALALIQKAVYSGRVVDGSYIDTGEGSQTKFRFLSAEQNKGFVYLTFKINSEKDRFVLLTYRFFGEGDKIIKEGEEKIFVERGQSTHSLKLILPSERVASVFLSTYLDEDFFYDSLPLINSKSFLTGGVVGINAFSRINKELLSVIGLFLAIAFVVLHYIHGIIKRNKLELLDVWVEHRGERDSIV